MSNTEAAQVSVPVTNSGQVVTTMGEVWRRFGRTGIQLAAGGGATGVVDQLASDLPSSFVPYLILISTGIVSFAQNYCESKGWIPIFLKQPPKV